jgi:beta-glucosidase
MNRPGEKQGQVFPPDFAWGVATSAHQVEGATTNNQWHAWECNGRIKSGDRVGSACDWWRNAEADFDLAQSLGINALRLSVEWSRIEPSPDNWDQDALARYRQMLKALRDRGIRPFVTLHHFTNPLWLESKSGFLQPESIFFSSDLRNAFWLRWAICAVTGRPLMNPTPMRHWDISWVSFLRAGRAVFCRPRE